jgi:ATP-dependent Lhr-like helicase
MARRVPQARTEPPLEPPAELARSWERDAALTEIVRGRLEGLGPVAASALAAQLSFSSAEVAIALARLESEGFALRGRFTANAARRNGASAGCSRGSTAIRLKRLRAEIEPVSAADYLRFLARWQRLGARRADGRS